MSSAAERGSSREDRRRVWNDQKDGIFHEYPAGSGGPPEEDRKKEIGRNDQEDGFLYI